jgi:hypothetical protein
VVHNIASLGRMTLLHTQEWCRRLGDDGCVVDGITGSGLGRWRHIRASPMVRNNDAESPGRTRRWRGGSGEDSTTAWALGRSTTARAPGKFLAENFGSQ